VRLLENFFIYLTVEKGLARNTVSSYHADLKKYRLFLDERKTAPVSATTADIIDFLEVLKNGGYSSASICRYISSIKALYKYMLMENEIDHDPSENIQIPRKWERLPKALSISDVRT